MKYDGNLSTLLSLTWADFEPTARELIERPLNPQTLEDWLRDWSDFSRVNAELSNRLYVAATQNTEDALVQQRYQRYLDELLPKILESEQSFKKRLLECGMEPVGMEIPLRNMRTQAEIFRQANLPLISEELKLGNEYDEIIGAQTIVWEGEERTLPQMTPFYESQDRALREKVWRSISERQLADRARINDLWQRCLNVRTQIAENAGFDNFRSYTWKNMLRFDYTPADSLAFHKAIEEVVIPAAAEVRARRAQRLGIDRPRPWDTEVDPLGRPPLRPFKTPEDLETTCHTILNRVDPQLGTYFATMRQVGLLDLENRKHKAPGGYCTNFDWVRQPFIFMNAVGKHDDVQTLLHEAGHAFHVFETAHLPYLFQLDVTMEFAEVASMAMELLAAPYLGKSQGGFYSRTDEARARIKHLEEMLLFWPYMAVVDAFQHWVYENQEAAADPANCDREWANLWHRFMDRLVDTGGLDEWVATGWQRKMHIFQVPFYYIEYGLAQMGAVQVWASARKDQAAAVAAYRHALSLGGTRSIPDLYKAAGARFAFDAHTLREAVSLMMAVISELETISD
jgi:oligoendopeptidase F